MDLENKEKELSAWCSTYGLLTARRILERFKINLDDSELIAALNNPESVYYQMLRVPLKNVFNGIILQQVNDYHVYSQKLMVDYLLSGEADKPETAQGADTREDLENERLKLMELGEAINKEEQVHHRVIAQSQAELITISKTMQSSLTEVAKKVGKVLKSHGISKSDILIQKAIRAGLI